MKKSCLKPGYLVSLKTSIRGGVHYQRQEIENEHTDEESGARIAAWQTRREIPDPKEYETAIEVRSKARRVVTAVCCTSSFGLLCPLDKEAALDEAVAAARALAAAHNAEAKRTQVEVYVLSGRIASDDAEAARAIGSELRELLGDMRAGIAAVDPERIREAASKARQLGGMLSAEVADKVSAAIDEARDAARVIAKMARAGENAAAVVDQIKVQSIEAARFAFLDLDSGATTPEAPPARAVDLTPAPKVARPTSPQVSMEI